MVAGIGMGPTDSCVSMVAIGSGTIRRCGLVGRSMSLCRWTLRSLCPSSVQCGTRVSFFLPSEQDIELLVPSLAPVCCHVSVMMIMD